ncbi:hypothetical protein PV327_005142 [Microctonus hyperodae]|uniref:F-box domain-containing protein n=1 Tax=Microctonus hyperodae TaxID=165561 RepID=A0AA39G0S2_MICHY|nr:hypothetical protein PV327_005142 [Microctonus hyperodae]
MAGIEILNHDVLIEIFSYLNIHERVHMGLVCKKWHDVVEIMMRSIHRMRCRVNDYRKYGRLVRLDCGALDVWSDDTTHLEKILEKFASNLNKIKIEDSIRSDAPCFNFKLLNKCTKLNYARLECFHDRLLEQFLEFLPTDNLEYLSINYNRKRGDYRWRHHCLLKTVLEKSRKLNSLDLKIWKNFELPPTEGMKNLKTLFLNFEELPHQQHFDTTNLQNLEKLIIICSRFSDVSITELMRNCRKLHTVKFRSENILPETALNEMISLPNLRHLHLRTIENSYESWHKFSNLESIEISQPEPFSSTRDQIISFIRRSINLKTYYFNHGSYAKGTEFNKLFHQIASDMVQNRNIFS